MFNSDFTFDGDKFYYKGVDLGISHDNMDYMFFPELSEIERLYNIQVAKKREEKINNLLDDK